MSLAVVRSDWRLGALVYYQTHRKRLIDALGLSVVKFLEDFVNLPVDDTTGDPTAWSTTVVEVGTGVSTMASLDGSGGKARLQTAQNENDGINVQLNGESFQLKATNLVYCGFFGVTLDEATQSDFFLGLAVTEAAILGGVTDRIGFQKLDGATALTFPIEKDSTETLHATGVTVAAAAMDLEFYWDGPNSSLEVFVDGVSVGKPAVTNLPDDEALRVSMEFLNGAVGAARTLDLDAIRVVQVGR